jgi:uncharacterized PurR-regulated membrane protein YhhQ (DUF165 family)
MLTITLALFLLVIIAIGVYVVDHLMHEPKPRWWEFVVFVLLVALASWTAMMFAAEVRG